MSPPILFLAAVLLAIAIVGEFVGAALLDNASHAGQRLVAARDDLDALVRRQLAEEIGLRGYVATGHRSFLEQELPEPSFDERARRLRAELSSTDIPYGPARLDAFVAA